MDYLHGHAMDTAVAGNSSDFNPEPEAMRTNCDGVVEDRHFGSWMGHVLPGLVFSFWGLWMAVHSFRSYLLAVKSRRRGNYTSRGWYELPSRYFRLLEPVMKILVTVMGLSMELYLDHPAYRYLYCPKGTKFEGRFALGHINNWQHAANYPGLLMSGLVDLVSTVIPLPEATCQVFLGLAFSLQAFLMATHKKHVPLDASVHRFLYYSMAGCAVSTLAEAFNRNNFGLSCARALFVTLQGAWMWTAATILFEHRPEWDVSYMGGDMICPVVFAMLMLCIAVGMLALFVVTNMVVKPPPVEEACYSRVRDLEMQGMMMSHDDGNEHGDLMDDSAQETASEDDLSIITGPSPTRHHGGASSLHIDAKGGNLRMHAA